MATRRGRYYLSRVIKVNLTQEKLISAILDAPVLRIGKYHWAITDAIEDKSGPPKFVFGKLAKYSSEGHVVIVDEAKKSQRDALARNLLVASSPFVYLPDYSGIAFLHVWDDIQEDLFPKRFCSLIKNAYHNFFVDCSVQPVADYRAFVEKLEKLDKIIEIAAKVHPPNPLFGHLWGDLKKYLARRNAQELSVREKKTDGDGLKTKLRSLMRDILKEPEFTELLQKPVDITDGAILMAADGYGKGKVVGEQKGEEVVIKTSDAHKSFLFHEEPDPAALASAAAKHFKGISRERKMKH